MHNPVLSGYICHVRDALSAKWDRKQCGLEINCERSLTICKYIYVHVCIHICVCVCMYTHTHIRQ